MQEWAQKFYKSTKWQRCRKAYINSLPTNLCERCELQIGTIVHHKKWLTKYNIDDPTVTLNWDNLILVCYDCHAQIHGFAKTGETEAKKSSKREITFIGNEPVIKKEEKEKTAAELFSAN